MQQHKNTLHNCGEIGIRTLGTVARTPHFECGPIDHSGISPEMIHWQTSKNLSMPARHLSGSLHNVAERGGFEPPVQITPYGSLANCWFQPLTHLSGR